MSNEGSIAQHGARVAVIGGGLIGAASALKLQRAGARVTLIDPGEAGARASFGNATLIANHLTEPLSSWAVARAAPGKLFVFGGPLDFVWRDIAAWAPFAVRYLAACGGGRPAAGRQALSGLMHEALPAWRRLLAEAGRPDLLVDAPHWGMFEDPAARDAEAAVLRAGDTGPVSLRELASQEIDAVRRGVSPRFNAGLAFEGSARLADPGAAVAALVAALVSAGGEVVQGAVRRLTPGADRVRLILADGRGIDADQVVIAAGARSGGLARQAGLTAPLIAERGYHLQYADHDVADGIPALICDERWVCIVRAGDDLRVTGFTEIGRPDSPPDPRKWAHLRRQVAELGLPVRGEPARWMGSRPTLPDFLPAIGRRGRVLYAFGHQHVGVTLAATTAEAVAALFEGSAGARLAPFDLARFG